MTSDAVPAALRAAGRALWVSVTGEYDLSPGELSVLEQACRTADELDDMAAALQGEPPLVEGSTGQTKVHPLYGELRQHRRVFDALITSLALPMPEESAGRPRSAQARRAAKTRHDRDARRGLRAVGGA
ncbi:hypothetical protein [Micromonospora maritima]|uniref:hypothetical protein n=1 Tax=Micromonospora maritima TaxID=986711 RepID=UPI00157CB264|nr:hypothetical protein [Micromonospora maritima]